MATSFVFPSGSQLLAAQIAKNDMGSPFANVMRGLAQDIARQKLEVAGVVDVTDSSSGTAADTIAAMTIPTAVFDASSSGGSDNADFIVVKDQNHTSMIEFGDYLNNILVRLGLPAISWPAGAPGTANTITAMQADVDTASGASALSFATGIVSMASIRNNVETLVVAVNSILAAVGEDTIDGTTGGTGDTSGALVAVADSAASADGSDSIAKAVMDPFVNAWQDNVATLADKLNKALFQAGLTDLTDSSGGVSDGDTLATAGADFTGHQDGGTDSSPKAGWDTEMAKLENNFADLALRTNLILDRYGYTRLVDSTTGTANTTLEVIDDTLTAVDGTGSNSLELASANTIKGKIEDNVATLIVEVNRLAPHFGEIPITDNFGGTASGTKTLVEIGASGAGVDNGAAATGVADADADAFLDRVADAFATIAAKVNAMTGTLGDAVAGKPIKVVATA